MKWLSIIGGVLLALVVVAYVLLFTGVGNDLILDNLKMLCSLGKNVRVRVPVIPGVTDTDGNFDAIGGFVAALETRPGVTLLPHHKTAMEKYTRFGVDKHLPDGTEAPSREALGRIASQLQKHGLEVTY